MPATPIDEQKPGDHQAPAYHAKLHAGHGNKFLKPALELFGESKIRQPFKKADESSDCKEIPP
jgi:hypothetical protein